MTVTVAITVDGECTVIPPATGLPAISSGDAGKAVVVNGDESGFELNAIPVPSSGASPAGPSSFAVVTSLGEMRSLDTSTVKIAELVMGGRSGKFVWTVGDFTTISTVDVHNAIYVVSETVPVTNGAWVRQRDNLDVHVGWSGATGDEFTDDTAFIQNSINLAMRWSSTVVFAEKRYKITATLNVDGDAFAWRSVRFRCDSATGNHMNPMHAGATIFTTGNVVALHVKFTILQNENFGIKGVNFYNTSLNPASAGYAIRMTRGASNNRYISGHVFEDMSIVGFSAGIEWQGLNTVNAGNNFFGNISMVRCNFHYCGYGWLQTNASCNLVYMENCLFFDCPYGGIKHVAGSKGCMINVTMVRCHMEAVGGMFRTSLTSTESSPGVPVRSRICLHDFSYEVCGASVTGGVASGDPYSLGVTTDIYINGYVDEGLAYGVVAYPAIGPGNTITTSTKVKINLAGGTDKSPAGMVLAPT